MGQPLSQIGLLPDSPHSLDPHGPKGRKFLGRGRLPHAASPGPKSPPFGRPLPALVLSKRRARIEHFLSWKISDRRTYNWLTNHRKKSFRAGGQSLCPSPENPPIEGEWGLALLVTESGESLIFPWRALRGRADRQRGPTRPQIFLHLSPWPGIPEVVLLPMKGEKQWLRRRRAVSSG